MAVSRREFCTALTGGALAKKVGNEVFIFEPDASGYTAKATGGTKPRRLADKFADVLHVKDFGARCDGVTDDTEALQAAIDAAAQKGCVVQIEGKLLVDSANVTLKKDTSIVGNAIACATDRHSDLAASVQSTIVLNGSYSIVMEENTAIENMRIMNKAVDLPYEEEPSSIPNISSFTGTAIQSTSNKRGITLKNISLLGFSKSIKLDTVYHTKIYSLTSDSVNGIDAEDCIFAHIQDCLFDETKYSNLTVTSGYRDDSVGFLLDNCNSFVLVNCMTHCHDTGFEIENSTKVYLKGCVANWNSSATPIDTTLGINISDSTYCDIEGTEVTHYGIGLKMDASDVRVVGNIFRQCAKYCISYEGLTKAVIVGNLLSGQYDTVVILNLDSTGLSLVFTNNVVYGLYSAGIASTDSLFSCSFPVVVKDNINFTVAPYFTAFDDSGASAIQYKSNKASAGGVDIAFKTSRGTIASPVTVENGDCLALIRALSWDGQNYSNTASIKFEQYGTYGGAIKFGTRDRTGGATFTFTRVSITDKGDIKPGADNYSQLGDSNLRFKSLYAVTGTIQTSDARAKNSVQDIPDSVLDAWGCIRYKEFKFNDAIESKGNSARTHVGLIAQDIENVFKAKGLDGFRYGLLCHDAWEAEEEKEKDPDTGEEKVFRKEAGDRYSLRYDEVFALESAYLRHRADQAEARISALEERLAAIEAKLG